MWKKPIFIAQINEKLQLEEVISDYEMLMSLTDELQEKQNKQEELYAFWEELNEESYN